MSLTSNAERLLSECSSSTELYPSESRVKVLEAEVQVLKKKNSTSRTRIEAVETMCQQYKTQAERAIGEKEIVMKGNETLLDKCEQLNSSLKDKEESEAQQLQKHQNEVVRLKSELDKKDQKMRKRDEILDTQCEKLKSFLKKEARHLQNYQNEVEKLNAELQKKDKELATLSIQNCKISSSSEKLSKENLQIRNVLSKLEASVTELQSRYEDLCQHYLTQVQQKTLEADRDTEENAFLMKQNEALLAKCEQLNSTLKEKEETQAQQWQLQKLLTHCEQVYSSLKEKGESQARQLQNHQKEVEKLNVQLERKDKDLENCMQEVADSNRKVVTSETSKELVMKQNETLLAKYGLLNSTLKEKEDSKIQNHQNKVEKLNADWLRKDKELENCMQEVVDLERVKASLESEVESLKKRISEQQKQQISTENEKDVELVVNEENDVAFTLQQQLAMISQKKLPTLNKNHLSKVVENKKNVKKKKSSVIQKVEEFQRKWKSGPKHGCEEQNNDIVKMCETCHKVGMNSRQIAQIKRKLAKFLGIQKVSLDLRLKLHKQRKTTSNTDLPFVLGPASSLVASALMSPQESNADAQYFPPLHLMVEVKREDTFQTNSDDQQMSNFDENPQSPNVDDIAEFQIKEEF